MPLDILINRSRITSKDRIKSLPYQYTSFSTFQSLCVISLSLNTNHNMTTFWNPREVLDLCPSEPSFTCSGTTRRGVQCRNWVNIADRQKASRLLDKLAQRDIVSRGVNNKMEARLQYLAEYTLCIRNHRDSQTEDVFDRLREDIEQFCLDEKRKARAVHRTQRLSTRVKSPTDNSTPTTTNNTSAGYVSRRQYPIHRDTSTRNNKRHSC
jgi:hypothetical protein